MKRLLLLFLLACCSILATKAQAQVTLTGKVIDKENGLILPYASIKNKSTGRTTYSDKGGFYKITANRGDLIVFSFLGYNPDSIAVSLMSGTEHKDVSLKVESKVLHSVEVSSRYSPYQADSIERREQFGYILDNPNKPLAGGNTPVGAGIVISPITRFSRKEKQKREFKKMFARAEEEKYIDSRYTKPLVSQVTGLKGDSLVQFMAENYPDYNTIRLLPQEDLYYWITDRYKAWVNKKK